MHLLIIGGTVFLGRHLVEAALARGHRVTLFNRGRHNPGLFPDVEKLRGDRAADLSALEGRRWDAVVDTSGYVPRVVRAAAELLAGRVRHYTFVSSCSVYRDWSVHGIGETYPLATLSDEQLREAESVEPGEGVVAAAYGRTYGALKALCERAAEEVMPGRVLHVRAGLIVGPHDYSDRFTYWPSRVARGGEVLAPGAPGRQVQIIDARDLAEWILRMAEEDRAGTFNASGPDYLLTMERVLEECREVCAGDARFVWMDDEFLLARGVRPWGELPLWIPPSDEEHRYLMALDCGRAVAAGLTFRPLAETIRDTLAWDRTRPAELERRAGLDPAREAELLAEWGGRR